MKLYGEIAKVEEQDDGTIKVYGYASSEAVDVDGEVIKADAMQAAIADYMKFPAVREMHQPIAAGTGIEMKVEDDGRTWFGAHVVDPVAVKKVVNKVYRGFSIGAKVTNRDDVNKTVITGLRLKEVSLVDRPANPEATIELWKADIDSEDAVDEIAKLLTDRTIDAKTLLDLAKGHLAPTPANDQTPAADVAKADTDVDVKKGLYELREFASMLENLGYLCSAAEYEKQMEGDNSPLPEAMRTWLASGVEIFQAMSKEETDELMERLQAAKKADTSADIQKAGARYSKMTKQTLAGIHKMIRECDKALGDMGYDRDDVEDMEHKSDTQVDVVKADASAEALADMGAQLKDLINKVARLEAEPVAPKGVLRAVDKADDGTTSKSDAIDERDLVKSSTGDVDLTASMIKLIHKHGGRPITAAQ
jgi:hypothetical protein